MGNLLGAFLISVCLLPGLLLRYAPFAHIVTPAQKRSLWLWYGIALAGTLALLHRFTSTHDFFLLDIAYLSSVFAIATSVINMLVIRGHLREHLFTFGIVINFSYLLMNVPSFVLSRIVRLEPHQRYLPTLGIYLVLLLLMYRPLRWLLNRTVTPFLALDSGSYWNTLWFTPLALFGTVLLHVVEKTYETSLSHLLGSVLLALVVVMLSLNVANDHKRLAERQTLANQLNDQKLHYGQLQAKMEEARKHKHDFQHHITAIQELAIVDDVPAILRYCDDLLARSRLYDHIPYTGHAAVDGILYRYTQLARENGIEFRVSGTIQSGSIPDIDLCVLLGNALENALAGCLTVPENRSIQLVAQSEAQTLSILIRNSFDGVVTQRGDKILSRKRTARTGVGLSSMRSACEQRGGTLEVTWDQTHFTVLMILPLL